MLADTARTKFSSKKEIYYGFTFIDQGKWSVGLSGLERLQILVETLCSKLIKQAFITRDLIPEATVKLRHASASLIVRL